MLAPLAQRAALTYEAETTIERLGTVLLLDGLHARLLGALRRRRRVARRLGAGGRVAGRRRRRLDGSGRRRLGRRRIGAPFAVLHKFFSCHISWLRVPF